MTELQRLGAQHAAALLRFEEENRAYFARSIPDRGDDYFAGFAERHAELLAEQAAGRHHFHVLVDDDGSVLARFNLVDVADGGATLGVRVAVDEVVLDGRPGLRHVLDLTARASAG